MTTRGTWPLAPLVIALSACAAAPPSSTQLPPAEPEALYTPGRVEPGRLEYAPDGTTFPPVLTERFAYPTQPQANAAYQRLVASSGRQADPASIRLFGCAPGALDAQTARVTRYSGPVVHCATDFLADDGRAVGRETANFYYYRAQWNMQRVDPPREAAFQTRRERSPRDAWWWLPGRGRFE